MGPRTPATLAGTSGDATVGGRSPASARQPAPVAGRFAAALVDWLLVALVGAVLLAALPQLVFAATGGDAEAGMAGIALVPVALALFVGAYFGVAWAWTGRTVGMLVLSLRLVERGSGRAPTPLRGVARTGVTLVTFMSVVALLLASSHVASLAAAATAAGLALAGHLWTLLDRDGRSLQDRALGLAVERISETTARTARRTL